MTEIASTAASPEVPARRAPPAHEHGVGPRHVFFVALPLLAMLAGAASMWHFVSFAILSNPILNGIIITVLCWGMWTMAGHLVALFAEERVFRAGMHWLRDGDASGEQNPRLGPPAFVTGMLERLQKLGLGHQVYIHSSAMEPEIEALEQYLNKRQELSQFLVGLMVGLGLLGTFVGLLETLVETSGLIATIAKSVGGGADMEGEFAKIVGGLQKPLSAMGTAFSASMFGLVGSIVLGFQMVAVRKAATDFVEVVRSQVLSLAEKSSVNENVEISERFLATLLADILEQHRASTTGLADVVARLDSLVPQVAEMAAASARLSERLQTQEQVLERTTATVGGVGDVVPAMGRLASAAEGMLQQTEAANERVGRMLGFLPAQEALVGHVREALARVDTLEREIASLTASNEGLRGEVLQQAALVKRMDSTLWNLEKDQLRDVLSGTDAKGGRP
ncbi:MULTISPECIES: hypothetical protein [Roseateles]|uniref:MotA/TolQ/ExbB proton channel family protein n=1 Tax=Pelomonas caseinilytica TaxID=2906763 RepID=A0ABS8XDA1_9BURK|nr:MULTISPECIES: hypothetical protein [unclassified Roseateles]MCE4536436.1 hypothetical protein [Pelomonas sp. P7]HEV6966230.1 hypothetical protein [Roseateles sp.]